MTDQSQQQQQQGDTKRCNLNIQLNNDIVWNKNLCVYDFSDTGRGVVALDDIEANEVLISVPTALLLHSRSLFSIQEFNAPSHTLQLINAKLDSKQRICLRLVVERCLKQRSKWYTYLLDVPASYQTISNYSDQDIQSLYYPPYIAEAVKLKNQLQDSFSRFTAIVDQVIATTANSNIDHDISKSDITNKESYEWAWGIIQTRTYYYSKNLGGGSNSSNSNNKDKDDCTVVPFADFFNHSCSVDTEASFNDKTGYYQVITKTPFAKDAQVFISYGKHSNFTLLSHYGFVVQDNPFEDISLIQSDAVTPNLYTPTTGDQVKTHEKKIKILETYGLGISGKFILCLDDALPVSWNYLSTLKVLFMSKQEINQEKEQNLFYYDQSISVENDRLVYTYLCNLVESLLKGFNHHYQSNRNRLKSEIQTIILSHINILTNCLHWLTKEMPNK
ncbi:hypothetical protein CYY_000764 [Polysphondylium violaceum]|uniref:SET domain-containing protein n=1 Tax=Polysphondylium violaceum TaxID=133409 RepID=A0A8J4Q4B7_9MYCE|nr:hypothetical protein CYY_000764 [Polysphondylium violaceum]